MNDETASGEDYDYKDDSAEGRWGVSAKGAPDHAADRDLEREPDDGFGPAGELPMGSQTIHALREAQEALRQIEQAIPLNSDGTADSYDGTANPVILHIARVALTGEGTCPQCGGRGTESRSWDNSPEACASCGGTGRAALTGEDHDLEREPDDGFGPALTGEGSDYVAHAEDCMVHQCQPPWKCTCGALTGEGTDAGDGIRPGSVTWRER